MVSTEGQIFVKQWILYEILSRHSFIKAKAKKKMDFDLEVPRENDSS